MNPIPVTFFESAENTALGTVIRESIWLFPVIEAIHLLGLCLLGGALLLVDLRLLGVGLTQQRIAETARGARPFLRAAIVVLLSTGVLLFLSESVKLYYSTAFWIKIIALPLALVLTLLIRDRFALDEKLETSGRSRLLGAASIILWLTVAAAGRWIGFSA